MSGAKVWIGLDLGRDRTHVCVVDDEGVPLEECDCPANAADVESALAAFPLGDIGLIAVEAGAEMRLVRALRARGFPIAVFESRKASRFLAIRRSKTDSGDARGLADLARLGRDTVSQVRLKSEEMQQLRSRIVLRHRLVLIKVAAEGALRSRLALHGRRLKSTRVPGGLRDQVAAHIAEIREAEGIDLSGDLRPLVDVCESLKGHLNQLGQVIERTAKSNPVCSLLMQVPGVGPICAVSFYSAIEDPARFGKSAAVGAYLGLVPRRYQSGQTSRTLGITKTGSKLTRSHLVAAATGFIRFAPDSALKEWAMAARTRLGSRRAKVAVARKLAIVLLCMWKSGSSFRPYPPVAGASHPASALETPR
jgi:transposase